MPLPGSYSHLVSSPVLGGQHTLFPTPLPTVALCLCVLRRFLSGSRALLVSNVIFSSPGFQTICWFCWWSRAISPLGIGSCVWLWEFWELGQGPLAPCHPGLQRQKQRGQGEVDWFEQEGGVVVCPFLFFIVNPYPAHQPWSLGLLWGGRGGDVYSHISARSPFSCCFCLL